ncbi:MAG: SRPBCC domain-containing protein [Bacteroidetes bacterium]|nr:SRPBCC domain-containing protein [Bacteroidota bacterium]
MVQDSTKVSMKGKSMNRIKLELEYPLRSSTHILYQYISTPSGLQSWFADHVEVSSGSKYLFRWEDGTETHAVMIKNITNKYVRFQVDNAPSPDEFMEFRISTDDITNDVELIVTEFINDGEEDIAASIWDSAVDNLKHIIGA